MSKIQVSYQNGNIFENPILCPHNKIVGKVQKIYHVEEPVRLMEVSHLTRIGQCDCPFCNNCNKLICDCKWKNGVGNYRTYNVQNRDASIFRYYTLPAPSDDYDEYPLRATQNNPIRYNHLYEAPLEKYRCTLLQKFRQRYRKSCDYLTGCNKSNESFNWIMKPSNEYRGSHVDITELKKQFKQTLKTSTDIDMRDGDDNDNNSDNDVKGDNQQQTAVGTYKQPIDESSSPSSPQKNCARDPIEYIYKNSIKPGGSNHLKKRKKNNDFMYATFSKRTNPSLANKRYIISVVKNYPPNMLPNHSEGESAGKTIETTKTMDTLRSLRSNAHHQRHHYKQQQQQQQQKQLEIEIQEICSEPVTTIEMFDNNIDLEQLQYKSSSTNQLLQQQQQQQQQQDQQRQQRKTIRNNDKCKNNNDVIEKEQHRVVNSSKIQLSRMTVNKGSFLSLNKSKHLNLGTIKNHVRKNSNASEMTASSKANSSIKTNRTKKENDINPKANDWSCSIHKPIHSKQLKVKYSKESIKKDRTKK